MGRNRKDVLIGILSDESDSSGNLIVEFLDRRGFKGLREATEESLEEYITELNLPVGDKFAASGGAGERA